MYSYIYICYVYMFTCIKYNHPYVFNRFQAQKRNGKKYRMTLETNGIIPTVLVHLMGSMY